MKTGNYTLYDEMTQLKKLLDIVNKEFTEDTQEAIRAVLYEPWDDNGSTILEDYKEIDNDIMARAHTSPEKTRYFRNYIYHTFNDAAKRWLEDEKKQHHKRNKND